MSGLSVIAILVFVGAWLTHVITCLIAQAWLLLIAGAIFAPIGVIHGIATWFGFPFV